MNEWMYKVIINVRISNLRTKHQFDSMWYKIEIYPGVYIVNFDHFSPPLPTIEIIFFPGE